METVLLILCIQAALGAFDNLWHHEITEGLPSKVSARLELTLHTIREALYAVLFILIGWYEMTGLWAWVFVALLTVEIIVTLADFVVEDQTRTLPKLERILHTILAINFGVILAYLIPEVIGWAQRPTDLVPVEYGFYSWAMTVFSVGVLLWAIRDAIAVVNLTIKSVPQWQRKPFKRGINKAPRTILVTGATGFIGGHLCRDLIQHGENVIVLTRDREKAEHCFGRHVQAITSVEEIVNDQKIDAIVNLAGAPVIGFPWTKTRRRELVESRQETTNNLIGLIARLNTKPEALISGSAIGYYGNHGSERLAETDDPQTIFMSRLCEEWEKLALTAGNYGVRVCLLRTGLVLGNDGGAFPQFLLPIRFAIGTIMGKGNQWTSWIHIVDMVRIIRYTIDTQTLEGPVNATAPEPVQHKTLMKTIGRAARRPVLLRVPAVIVRFSLGEMADIFVEGQRVVPNKLLRTGFNFMFETIDDAVSDLTAPKSMSTEKGVTVYYNDRCPICRAEIGMYRKKSNSPDDTIAFADVNATFDQLEPYGFSQDDLIRRMYVIDRFDEMRGGVDAFIALWSEIPTYRWQSRLLRVPVVYQLAGAIYDGIMVPALYAWNKRRSEQRQTAELTEENQT